MVFALLILSIIVFSLLLLTVKHRRQVRHYEGMLLKHIEKRHESLDVRYARLSQQIADI